MSIIKFLCGPFVECVRSLCLSVGVSVHPSQKLNIGCNFAISKYFFYQNFKLSCLWQHEHDIAKLRSRSHSPELCLFLLTFIVILIKHPRVTQVFNWIPSTLYCICTSTVLEDAAPSTLPIPSVDFFFKFKTFNEIQRS